MSKPSMSSDEVRSDVRAYRADKETGMLLDQVVAATGLTISTITLSCVHRSLKSVLHEAMKEREKAAKNLSNLLS